MIQSGDMTNLGHNRFYELLPVAAGVFGYDQDVVAEIEGSGQRLGTRGRVDRDPRLRAPVPDQLQGALQVRLGLDVDRDHVRPGVEESTDVLLRLLDHQMTVEGQFRSGP